MQRLCRMHYHAATAFCVLLFYAWLAVRIGTWTIVFMALDLLFPDQTSRIETTLLGNMIDWNYLGVVVGCLSIILVPPKVK